jgi:hypothetical protein
MENNIKAINALAVGLIRFNKHALILSRSKKENS